MKKVYLFLSLVIVLFSVSCSDKKSGPDSHTISEFCKPIDSSSDSVLSETGISALITDLCSGDAEKISMYSGSGSVDVREKDPSADKGSGYSYVYFQGGLQLSGISSKLYFNMVKDQVSDSSEISTSNNYKLDDSVTEYKATVKSDSKVEYYYYKEDIGINPKTEFGYCGVTNFITITEGSLYVVANKLNTSKKDCKSDDVKKMYSVSIIGGKDSASVYMGMTQTANNHNDHASSVKQTKKFFKEDAERSYDNAQNYKKRH